MRNCRVYVERRIGNRDFRLCCTLVPVPAASYPPKGRQFPLLLCAISPHLRLRPLPGHRYRLSPCPWLPFTVTWLGRDLPALAGSPASSRAVPGTQRLRLLKTIKATQSTFDIALQIALDPDLTAVLADLAKGRPPLDKARNDLDKAHADLAAYDKTNMKGTRR